MNDHKVDNQAGHKADHEADHETDHESRRIAKEMSPYLIYAAIPILIIVFIALKFGPSY